MKHISTLIVATFAGLSVSAFVALGAERMPNLVIIFTDDQGYSDVGVFGAEGFDTPRLDRLAAEGRVFRNFHAAQAVCSASRAALLTGCYPNRLEIHGAFGPRSPRGIHADEVTLAELVKQKGYATACFGKWHLGDAPKFRPTRHGFDEYFGLLYSNDMWPFHPDMVRFPAEVAARKRSYPPISLYSGEDIAIEEVTAADQAQLTTWYTEKAVDFIDRNRERPFFLYLAHSMPHVPLFVSDKYKGKTERGLYGDVIEEIDWSVGQILDALERNGLTDNTWVIYTSDNGPWLSYGEHSGTARPLREGKGTSWEGGTRVPCIMRWPGHLPAGTECNDMLMTIDLFPTIAARFGLQLPEHAIDGLDCWDLISGKPGAANPHASYWFYYAHNQLQAVSTGDGRWKLYFPHKYRSMEGRPGGKGGMPEPYGQLQVTRPELYDLRSDLSETTDVASEHPEIVERLMAEAERARTELGDALTQRTGRAVRPIGQVDAL